MISFEEEVIMGRYYGERNIWEKNFGPTFEYQRKISEKGRMISFICRLIIGIYLIVKTRNVVFLIIPGMPLTLLADWSIYKIELIRFDER